MAGEMTNKRHAVRMDLPGRLRNTKVAAQDALLPLFEAVVNSIHSTQELFGAEVERKGRVEVTIHRQTVPLLYSVGRPALEPVDGFTITDNGVGFTDANLRSFEIADSDAKLARGGKGIGRLTWLVVFERAEIDSTYKSDGTTRRRAFHFVPTDLGIEYYVEPDASQDTELSTRIALAGTRPHFREALRHGIEYIAD